MGVDRLRTLIEGADEKTLSLYKQNLANQWDRFSPEQQRDAFERLSQFPQFKDFERFQTKEPEREKSTLEKIAGWMEWPGKTFATLATSNIAINPIAAGFRKITPKPTESEEGLSWWQREQKRYERMPSISVNTGLNYPSFLGGGEITLGVKGALEQIPYFMIPGAGGVYSKLGTVAAKGGLLGRSAALAAKAVKPAVMVENALAKPLEKLTEILKGAKYARQLVKPIRKVELGGKFAQAEAAWDAQAGIEGYKASLRKLKGNLTAPKFELGVTEGFDNIVNDVFDTIKGMKQVPYGDRITMGRAMSKIMTKEVPQPAEIRLIEKYLSPALAGVLEDISKSGGTKAFEKVIDVLGMPRSVLSSTDLSGLLRQGGILATRHPLDVAKSTQPMLKALLSDKNALIVDGIRKARPNYMKGVQHNLYMSPIEVTKVGLKEEAFASNFVHKIPVIGQIVKGSERAYITVLNEIRSRVWETTIKGWEKLGQKITNQDLDELARFINYATGRGDTRWLGTGNVSTLLNATLFSPKLIMSRIQLPTMLFSKSPLVRKEAIKTLATFMGTGVTLLGVLDLAGVASVGWLDPRSSDFGKMKVGNTRLDIWNGYLQYIRFISQITTGQRKTTSGDIVEISRKEVLDRFAQSKASPAFGFLIDMLKGETYMGEEISLDTKDVGEQLKNRLLPLFVQDMWDAIGQEGLTGGLIAAPSLLGVGAVTYVNEPDKLRKQIAQDKGFNSWEDLGQKLGRNEQLKIESTYPELKKAIEDLKKKETSSDYISSQWRDVGEGIEETFQLELENASREFRDTGNGQKFRERIRLASYARRAGYASRSNEDRFKDLVDKYEKPLTEDQKKKMNSKDIALREYYNLMYADSMYDEYGNYDFNRADQIRSSFSPEQLAYVEENLGIKQEDYPEEVKYLKEVQKYLQPYWDVSNQIWNSMPKEIKDINDQLVILGQTDPEREKQILKQYPMILWARKRILEIRKQMRQYNPELKYYISLFY